MPCWEPLRSCLQLPSSCAIAGQFAQKFPATPPNELPRPFCRATACLASGGCEGSRGRWGNIEAGRGQVRNSDEAGGGWAKLVVDGGLVVGWGGGGCSRGWRRQVWGISALKAQQTALQTTIKSKTISRQAVAAQVPASCLAVPTEAPQIASRIKQRQHNDRFNVDASRIY